MNQPTRHASIGPRPRRKTGRAAKPRGGKTGRLGEQLRCETGSGETGSGETGSGGSGETGRAAAPRDFETGRAALLRDGETRPKTWRRGEGEGIRRCAMVRFRSIASTVSCAARGKTRSGETGRAAVPRVSKSHSLLFSKSPAPPSSPAFPDQSAPRCAGVGWGEGASRQSGGQQDRENSKPEAGCECVQRKSHPPFMPRFRAG